MFRFATLSFALVMSWVVCSSTAVAAEPRIAMELFYGRGLPLTAPQEWSRMLSEVGVNGVQLRRARGGEEVTIETRGSGRNISYEVSGIIIADNQLIVPGGRFGISDRQKLDQWLQRLRDDGPELLTARETPPFNLTGAQLERLSTDLEQRVTISTKGQDPRAVIDRIERNLSVPLQVDRAAMAALRTAEPIEDELQGLSAGTVLAAVVRPLGLALVPEREQQSVRTVIRRANSDEDIWPIGWPLKGKRQAVAPQLFEMLPVEIDDFPLLETLAALQERIELPMLFDYNSLARQGIDLENARASYPGKKTSYSLVLGSILAQSRLKGELRLDDAGTPFFWITTLKQ